MSDSPRVGISACLLGERVRYDGDHKRQHDLLAHFQGRVEWIPVCPEVELGLGVPRETIGIRETGRGLRLIAHQTGRDLTAAMRTWAARRLDELPPLAGFVLKTRSPSCGVASATVEGTGRTTDGFWTNAIRERFPALPLAQETDLASTADRERFLRRIRACRRLNGLFRPGWTPADVVAFHSTEKLRLTAHSPEHAAQLGRLVAEPDAEDFERRYRSAFLEALSEKPTPGRESNALAHAFGYFSQDLPSELRRELHDAIEAVARGGSDVPSLKSKLKALALQHNHNYLAAQTYWNESESAQP